MPKIDSAHAADSAQGSSALANLVRLLARQAAAEWLANSEAGPSPEAADGEAAE